MERLIEVELEKNVELIENISGGNQEFRITYTTKEKDYYKIEFDFVVDLKYTIEDGTLERFYHYRENNDLSSFRSSMVRVEGSEYSKYFIKQASSIYKIDGLKHYILTDRVDTVLDILTYKEPKIERINS